MECIMDEPTVLRTTKIGGGFVKEDVMTYLDELNSKIVSLEDELKKAQEKGPADPQELIKYRNQVENLQEKLNTSNNALRNTKKELEEAKKQLEADEKLIAQLKAGGANAGAANAQAGAQANANAQALEAARKEIDNLKSQLTAAQQKAAAAAAPVANAQANAALDAAKKEIETLKSQLAAAQQKPNSAAPAQNGAAKNEELAKAKQEITRISNDLAAKTKEISNLTNELNTSKSSLDSKNRELAQITKDHAAVIAKKDAEIVRLNDEITDLKENEGSAIPASFDMGALFTEAQKTAGKITIEAQRNADRMTKEAKEKADQILKEANTEAEKTVSGANLTAETCIKEANDQAKNTVDEANAHAEKVNEMSKTVRDLLLNEIENVNTKFNDITSVLSRLTGQANDRMSEAQLIIGEARKVIDSSDASVDIKKNDAPKADFEPSKAPKSSASDRVSEQPSAAKQADPFASVGNSTFGNGGYNNAANSFNKNDSMSSVPPQPKQPAPAKKSANFNFDMAELLKAAEEEAAKESENN